MWSCDYCVRCLVSTQVPLSLAGSLAAVVQSEISLLHLGDSDLHREGAKELSLS